MYPQFALLTVMKICTNSLLSPQKVLTILSNLLAFEEEEHTKRKEEVKPEHVLGAIEEAYPNSLTIDDMSRRFALSQENITTMVMELVERSLVKAVGAGGSADGAVDPFAAGFRRVHQGRISNRMYHSSSV